MLKKTISFRIDEETLEELDSMAGSRTENITKAIRSYTKTQDKGNTNNTDTKELITSLQDRIIGLERDKDFLKEKISNMEQLLAHEQRAHHEVVQRQLIAPKGPGWRRLIFWK